MPRQTAASRSPRVQRHSANADTDRHASAAAVRDDRAAKTEAWHSLFFLTTKPDAPLLLVAILSSVIASLTDPAQAFIIGKVFDAFVQYAAFQISAQDLLAQEERWILWLTCIAVGSWLFHLLELMTWMLFGERQAERARRKLYSVLSNKEIGWYDMQEHGISALLASNEKNIRDMQLAVSQPFGGFIATISTALASLGQAFYNSWKLSLVTLATSPLIVAVLWLFSIGMQTAIANQRDKLGEAQKISFDALSAIDTVKCFNAEETELDRYGSRIEAAAKYYHTIVNKAGLQLGCLTFLVQAMFVQAFYYGGVLISQQEKTIAQVITTFFSAIAAFQAAQAILPQWLVLEKGRSAAGSLRSLLKQDDVTVTEELCSSLVGQLSHGEIILENVNFSYPTQPSQQVLQDVSLTFPAGQTTFVIGKSGSGKSTIGQLLVKFYEPSAGRIILDGDDMSRVSPQSVRRAVTLVEQSSVLFAGSILDNLELVDRHGQLSKKAVRNALAFAMLQSTVNDLPNGIDTIVGKAGASLSGGQCQRVALARARIRDTPILILDEATSALDQITRDLIMAAIREWRQGKTTVIITHEIRQLEAEDFAVIMHNGQVVQQGRRADMELMLGSPFQRLVASSQVQQAPAQHQAVQLAHPAYFTSSDERWTTAKDLYPSTRFLPSMRLSMTLLSSLPNQALWSVSSSPFRQQHTHDRDSVGVIPRQDLTGPQCIRQSDASRCKDWLDLVGTAAKEQRLREGSGRRRATKDSDEQSAIESKQSVVLDRTLKRILQQVWPNLTWKGRLCLLLGFYAGTVHAVCSPVFAYVLSKLLALYALPVDHSQQSLTYSLAILAIAAGDGVHYYLCRFMFEKAAQNWVDSLRQQAMRRLIYQPRSFFDRSENNVFSITQDLDRSGEEMRNLLGRFVGLMYIAFIIVISSVIWAMTTQWKMVLFALATGPYILLVTYSYSKCSERMEAQADDAARKIATSFEDVFSCIRTVRALQTESHLETRFRSAMSAASRVGLRRALITGLLYGLSDSASSFSIAYVFYVGSRLVSDGAAVLSIVQVFVVLVFAITNVVAILGFIPQIGSAKVTAARVLQLAHIEEETHESYGDICLARFGHTTFDRLTFAYESRPESTVLQDVSFTLRAGSTMAIVGGSGSGKSTVAKILLKLYAVRGDERPQSGAPLKVSGRPIQDIETRSLRDTVGVVLQSNPVFSGSISENITYGLASDSSFAKQDNIVRAASQAGIADFIASLPDGFQTRVGDGGMTLSGGQAQRVAIARALVRCPSALIFDEATSALDAESAATIRTTVQQLSTTEPRMTVLIITHSKEMMEIAEEIIVLDRGRVVETGAYSDVVRRNGPLSKLLSSGVWDADDVN